MLIYFNTFYWDPWWLGELKKPTIFGRSRVPPLVQFRPRHFFLRSAKLASPRHMWWCEDRSTIAMCWVLPTTISGIMWISKDLPIISISRTNLNQGRGSTYTSYTHLTCVIPYSTMLGKDWNCAVPICVILLLHLPTWTADLDVIYVGKIVHNVRTQQIWVDLNTPSSKLT